MKGEALSAIEMVLFLENTISMQKNKMFYWKCITPLRQRIVELTVRLLLDGGITPISRCFIASLNMSK